MSDRSVYIMGFLFFALIFLLFDLTVTELQIDILFDFAGWALMLAGLKSLKSKAKALAPLQPVSALMLVASILFVCAKVFVLSDQSSLVFAADLIYSALKNAALTAILFAVFKQKEFVRDTSSLYRAKNIWLIYLILWAVYIVYAAFAAENIVKAAADAVTQILVISMIFIQVLFLITVYKIKKVFVHDGMQKGR